MTPQQKLNLINKIQINEFGFTTNLEYYDENHGWEDNNYHLDTVLEELAEVENNLSCDYRINPLEIMSTIVKHNRNINMRELYLNIDLKNFPKGTKFETHTEDWYMLMTKQGYTDLAISVLDIDAFIKAGVIRDVIQKWSDEDMVEMCDYCIGNEYENAGLAFAHFKAEKESS